jgi:hypothetical protein
MTIFDFRHAAVLAAGVAALSLAACGSNSAAGNAPTTSASTAGQPSAAGTGNSTGAGSARPVDVCMTLPAASAAQLSGQPITTATAITEQAPSEYGCAYSSDDDSVQVEVQVFQHDAASSYATFLAGSPGASAVGGLGDKAFFDNQGTMYVLLGNNLIQVNGLDTADQSAALARPILAVL